MRLSDTVNINALIAKTWGFMTKNIKQSHRLVLAASK